MGNLRTACTIHQDDWIHLFTHPQLQEPLFWCPECDAVWLSIEDLSKPDQKYGITFTRIYQLIDLHNIKDFWDTMIDLGVWER
jgi:hypothetical protein